MRTQGAIARVWNGHVPMHHGDGFMRHLLETGVSDAMRTEGCLGALVLRRIERQRVLFTLLTFWRDAQAERAFSPGEAAVPYSGDEAYELVADTDVVHHFVVFDRWMLPYSHSDVAGVLPEMS